MKHTKAGSLACLAVLLALGSALSAEARAVKGQQPPDFTGTTLDGRKVSLADFRGKNPLVLSFYANFVQPSRAQFKQLKELDERLGGQGLRVLAVSLDEDRESASVIPNQTKARFPVIFDPKAGIADKYAVQAMPHTVVIDRAGKVQAVLSGYDPDDLDKAASQVVK